MAHWSTGYTGSIAKEASGKRSVTVEGVGETGASYKEESEGEATQF